MMALRTLLCLLLVVALLPWGSALRAAEAVAAQQAVDAVATDAQPAPAILRAADRHCRTGTLPGHCHAELVRPTEAALPPPPVAGAVARSGTTWPAEGLLPAPPRDPPRPV